MKTKAEIIKRLLEEKKIDVDEAMVLMMNEGSYVQFVPYPNPYPMFPIAPYNPLAPLSPYYITCKA